ncbi:segregation and condensation protein B [Streptomyces sp. TLI_235]|nr:segregation and condensation protein B [Streptomyces sp. TLI_235]
MNGEQPRPSRRTLGLPGQTRPDEWLEPAYGPEQPEHAADGAAPRAEAAPTGAQAAPAPGTGTAPGAGAAPAVEAAPERPYIPGPAAEPAADTSEPEPMPDPAPLPVPEPEPEPEPELPEEATGTGVPLRAALEAILMVVDEPATETHLAAVLERPRAEVAAALRELAAEYTAQGRGFDLRNVAGGWRFYTRADCAPAVDRYVLDGQQARLTQAALETLAVVAYRQPVSRSRVSAVRGVNCDGVMRTLVQRGLVEETGSEPETGAILYRTTNYFLERTGLRGLDELPELAPFLPEVDDVEAESLEGTMIAEAVAAARAADGENA